MSIELGTSWLAEVTTEAKVRCEPCALNARLDIAVIEQWIIDKWEGATQAKSSVAVISRHCKGMFSHVSWFVRFDIGDEGKLCTVDFRWRLWHRQPEWRHVWAQCHNIGFQTPPDSGEPLQLVKSIDSFSGFSFFLHCEDGVTSIRKPNNPLMFLFAD